MTDEAVLLGSTGNAVENLSRARHVFAQGSRRWTQRVVSIDEGGDDPGAVGLRNRGDHWHVIERIAAPAMAKKESPVQGSVTHDACSDGGSLTRDACPRVPIQRGGPSLLASAGVFLRCWRGATLVRRFCGRSRHLGRHLHATKSAGWSIGIGRRIRALGRCGPANVRPGSSLSPWPRGRSARAVASLVVP